ncbi:hypothetical protein P154DRAFT_333951 [Amniculicola lignicola CBS 123094]|uniref:Uncharacterized protein n=1 Tax=Amniculicola lignicola CBS 123094 TaxID=1392246 RepID=A0A6A5W3L6_9PLEO|nr:hypothetical protein P154DRAFT_333951 [Amniculicola lignicola CBS 123094]
MQPTRRLYIGPMHLDILATCTASSRSPPPAQSTTVGSDRHPSGTFRDIEQLEPLEWPFRKMFNVESLRNVRTLHWLMRKPLLLRESLQTLGRPSTRRANPRRREGQCCHSRWSATGAMHCSLRSGWYIGLV